MPRYYDVNVRAVVRATRIDPEATGDIPDWEVYDTDVEERDHDLATVAVFRWQRQSPRCRRLRPSRWKGGRSTP